MSDCMYVGNPFEVWKVIYINTINSAEFQSVVPTLNEVSEAFLIMQMFLPCKKIIEGT
jgi:hypothetical protein